jgi:hypothetical protein
MSETSETPLPTQPAAPPVVPPKRSIVGVSMADGDDGRGDTFRSLDETRRHFEETRRRFEETQRRIDETLRQLQAKLARFLTPPAGPDHDA